MRPLGVVAARGPFLWAPAPRRVPIASWTPTAVPRPPTTRRPELGQASLHLSNLPTSIMVAAVGGGAIFISKILPSPIDHIVTAAGFVAVGYSVYHLFAEPAEEKARREAAERPRRTPPAAAFAKIGATWQTPAMNGDVATHVFSRDYDASIVWFNNSEEEVNLAWDVLAVERGINLFGGGLGEPKTAVVHTGQLTLPPNSSQGPIPLEIDLVSWIAPWEAGMQVRLAARKFDAGGRPIPVASVQFFVHV